MEEKYCIEDYRAAKTEILSTIDFQFKIISVLVTATAAVLVYLFKRDLHQVVFSACLLIPGIYSFFGVLWLDQVYRQRRLAAYIFEIESAREFFQVEDSKLIIGWEHFVRENRLGKGVNIPSRCYYLICLGLFFFFRQLQFFSRAYIKSTVYSSQSMSCFGPSYLEFLYIVCSSCSLFFISSVFLGYQNLFPKRNLLLYRLHRLHLLLLLKRMILLKEKKNHLLFADLLSLYLSRCFADGIQQGFQSIQL